MKGLGAIIDAARSVSSRDAYDRALLDTLGKEIGFDVAFCVREGGASTYAPGFDDAVRRATARRWAAYGADFADVARIARSRRGVAVDREVLGQARLERTRVYRELMLPHRGQSSLITYLGCADGNTAAIMLGRTGPRFSDAERELMERAAPILGVCERAVAHVAEIARAEFRLTRRERDIVAYLRLGYTNSEIALACGTAPRTVRNQLSHLFEKMGASTRAEAVAISFRGG